MRADRFNSQERNSLGGMAFLVIFCDVIIALTPLSAVKAVTAAQLSMASLGVYSVTLDEAIEAMRLTASDMSVKYKETSLSVRNWFIASYKPYIHIFASSFRDLL